MALKVSREYLLYQQNLGSSLYETTTSSPVKAKSTFRLSAAMQEQILSMQVAREQKCGGRLEFVKDYLSRHRDDEVLQDSEPDSD